MKRNEFISTLGIGLAAACVGCLAACSKSDDPGPTGGGGTTNPPPAAVSFTVDLNNEIKAVGETKTSGGVIIARIATGNVATSFSAVQVACTHEGTSINFSATQGRFVCPSHAATFTTSGAVINGPARINLKKYNVSITGSTLTVSG